MKGCLRVALLLTTCTGFMNTAGAQLANPYARPDSGATTVEKNARDDFSRFATGGFKVLESVKGDLTGAGHADVLLVLDPPLSDPSVAREGLKRSVLLLVRDSRGDLQKAASNLNIVPCSTCAGAAGDPYAYSKIEKGHFTIVLGGGSRERWTDEYSFIYAPDTMKWLVSRVVRKVVDMDSNNQKQIELTGKELGEISFNDFDPEQLPEVTLP
ncbi:hypothetical protein PFUM301598_16920 [Pseudomonas fluorescens]